MNLHRKGIQDRRKNWVAWKPKGTSEEVPKYDNLSVFGNRDLFVQWSSPGAGREEASCFIFSDHVCSNLRFSENKRRRQRSRWPCSDQISDVFVICPDLTILVTPGTAGCGRAPLFVRWSILKTLENRFGWETSCSKVFGRHGSCGAFNSSHLFDNVAEREEIRTTFVNKIRRVKEPNTMERIFQS
jgi:hypothetical protein